MIKTKVVSEELDKEWTWLLLEAKKIGIEIAEIKAFLASNGDKLLGTDSN